MSILFVGMVEKQDICSFVLLKVHAYSYRASEIFKSAFHTPTEPPSSSSPLALGKEYPVHFQ